MTGCGGESRTRINSILSRALWFPIELRRNFGGPEGSQTLTRSLQDFYAVSYITSPKPGGCGWIRTTNLALLRRPLFPFELHSRCFASRGRGVRPTRLLQLHGPRHSPFCRDEPRPDTLRKNFGGRSWATDEHGW